MSRRVWIIQKPKVEASFDDRAIKALGDPFYLLPAVPNLMDQERIDEDIRRIASVLKEGAANDVFISLGGSPVSQMIFGAAIALAGVKSINFGLYSRPQDRDGRRGGANGQRGSYRIVPLSFCPALA